MDWALFTVAVTAIIPLLFLVQGIRKRNQQQAEFALRKLMLRIGIEEEKKLSLEELFLAQKNKNWFQYFEHKLKEAGMIERQDIMRLVTIQAVLLVISVSALIFSVNNYNPKVVLVALILPVLPWAFLLVKGAQRQAKLRQDFPEMLESIVRSIQAGFGIDGSLKVVSEDMQGPLAAEVGEIHKQMKLGISQRDVLREFQSRVIIPEAQYFAITLILQRESGGPLAPILRELSTLMRRRENFQAKLKTLTAESRFTAWFIGGMPLAYLGYKFIFDYASMSFFLHDPTGVKMFALSVGLIVLGSFILSRMLKLRF